MKTSECHFMKALAHALSWFLYNGRHFRQKNYIYSIKLAKLSANQTFHLKALWDLSVHFQVNSANFKNHSHPAFTCSKSTIKALEQYVIYVHS